MKKYFVSSDIHSFYDEWMNSLSEKGFDINNDDHIIITCGDLLDRGEKPKECLKFVNDLHKKGRAICVKGNHEYLFEEVIQKRYYESHDESNGTVNTFEYISGEEITNRDGRWNEHVRNSINKTKADPEVRYYFDHLVDYYEGNNYIFVHGWIPLGYSGHDIFWNKLDLQYDKDWREKGDFEDASWLNGMYQWKRGNREPGKTIVCGHFHASWGHANLHNDGQEYVEKYETMWVDSEGVTHPYARFDPFIDDGIIAIDACTVVNKFVNVLVINENEL